MTEPLDDNLDDYALGFCALGKGIQQEAYPYAEGRKAHDLWLAGYDAASRGHRLEDRQDR